jgi:general secretion pathway protein H
MARTPTSAPGSEPAAGFTLVELLIVLVLLALASGLAGLALRDGRETRLEREAVRLSALLEAGRAASRASGVAVRFELATPGSSASRNGEAPVAFRFVGLPPDALPAGHWLEPDTQAEIPSARALVLGPEPLIPAQRLVIKLDGQQRVVATDGLAAFAPLPLAP